MAAYLLENGVQNNQSSLGDTVHDRVIRASFTDDSFGMQMVDSLGSKDAEFSFSASLTPEGEAISDRSFEILVLVWKKEDGQYIVENAHVAEIGATTNVESFALDSESYNVYQSGSDLVVDLQNSNVDKIFNTIDIYDLSGTKIMTKQIRVHAGENQFVFPLFEITTPQVYIVRTGRYSKKVLLK